MVCISVFRYNSKITRKETFQKIFRVRHGQQEKLMDFDKREEYLKGISYIKQNIIMAVLRKVHSHSVLICRLIRKSIMQKKIQGEKLIETLIFPKRRAA